MRPLLLIALVLALAGVGVLLLLDDDRGGRPGDPGDATPGGTAAIANAGPDVEDGELRVREEIESEAPVAEVTDDVAPRPVVPTEESEEAARIRRRDQEKFWRACMNELDGDAMRECLRAQLAGYEFPPEELANVVCGQVPPDGLDRMFIEEVAAGWPASDTPRRIRVFHDHCNDPGNFWPTFLNLQAERDPEWLAEFAGALSPDLIFEGDATTLLYCVEALARQGHEDMIALLESGARGELGGGERQVAYALANAFGYHEDPNAGLAFVRSVIDAPGFQARPAEVEAVSRVLLEGSTDGVDVGASVRLMHDVLANPALATGFAEYVLKLNQWNRMPFWMPEVERQALVQMAQDTL